ncbi:MAG TPA: hypothetical protein VHM30_16085 [Gemmatimonadaceae bacterium]|nr:hypothetical protein [Gemmatimonadaceae bacterium]
MRDRPRSGRRGAILLEAIVALAILVFAGAAVVAALAQSFHAVEAALRADREMEEASGYLDVVALWPRADLDRHLGDREQGPWRMRVERPLSTVYEVTLSDSTGMRQLLRTRLFLPREGADAP